MASTDPAWRQELARIERVDLAKRCIRVAGQTYGRWNPDEVRGLLLECADWLQNIGDPDST